MNLLRHDCALRSKQHAYLLLILGLVSWEEIGLFYQIIQNVTWQYPKSEEKTQDILHFCVVKC